MNTKTLTMRIVAQSIVLTGRYVRERKNGRPFFDVRECAYDLARELIACGALCVDHSLEPAKDEYRFKVYVYAGQKSPGLEGDVFDVPGTG